MCSSVANSSFRSILNGIWLQTVRAEQRQRIGCNAIYLIVHYLCHTWASPSVAGQNGRRTIPNNVSSVPVSVQHAYMYNARWLHTHTHTLPPYGFIDSDVFWCLDLAANSEWISSLLAESLVVGFHFFSAEFQHKFDWMAVKLGKEKQLLLNESKELHQHTIWSTIECHFCVVFALFGDGLGPEIGQIVTFASAQTRRKNWLIA